MDCIFIDEGYCSAAAVEIDPDTGCATYAPSEDDIDDDDWDDDELEGWDDDADDEDDLWLDDDDDL
jgi:hypothetical protein